jgi:hypothetical protein
VRLRTRRCANALGDESRYNNGLTTAKDKLLRDRLLARYLIGEVAEWSNAPDSKSGIPVSGIVGSNPTLSATQQTPLVGVFCLAKGRDESPLVRLRTCRWHVLGRASAASAVPKGWRDRRKSRPTQSHKSLSSETMPQTAISTRTFKHMPETPRQWTSFRGILFSCALTLLRAKGDFFGRLY